VTYLTDYLDNGVYAPLWYGKKLGYFAKEGIDLSIEYGTGSVTTAQAISSGKATLGDIYGGTLAEADEQGGQLESVGFFRADGGFAFFCADSLHVHTIAEMKGLSVIIPPGTVQAELYPGALKAGGLSKSSIQVLSVSGAIAGADYAGGTGDCIAETTNDAPVFESHRPSTTILWTSAGFNAPGFAFVGTKAFVASHTKIVREFLTAAYESIAASLAHPNAAAAAFVAANPSIPAALADAQWKDSEGVFCTSGMTSANVDIGYQLPSIWSSGLAILQKYQGLSPSLSATSLYTNEFFTKYHVSTTACGSVGS
jgi:NitT/TauT family transport system substrate-binding protein